MNEIISNTVNYSIETCKTCYSQTIRGLPFLPAGLSGQGKFLKR